MIKEVTIILRVQSNISHISSIPIAPIFKKQADLIQNYHKQEKASSANPKPFQKVEIHINQLSNICHPLFFKFSF
tara:strand:+ start:45 stop:269 length:225 start_codon:yes stop_codon:yes gene_type:complete